MGFFTDNPESDAISHILKLDSIKDEKYEECEVCGDHDDDCRKSPDGDGKVCPRCLGNGNAKEYYLENMEDPEIVEQYFNQLKLK